MDEVEERLIEQVRKYDHLYNSSSKYYKHSQMSNNTWKEISQNLGVDSAECLKRWKNLRDKFVRHRKRLCSSRGSGAPGRRKLPAFYVFMSWLEPHVKHRETESRCEFKEQAPQSTSNTDSQQSSSTSESDAPLPPASPAPAVPARGSKRKITGQGDMLNKHLTRLGRQLQVEQKLAQKNDECSRFGQMVADMLRRVPENKMADVMYTIFTTLYENRQQ